jgi:hypothetical protein
MGIAKSHAGRRSALALILLVTVALLIVAASMAISASFGAQDAQALPTFTQAVNGIGPCSSCHSGAYPTGVHAVAAHAGFIATCTTCHTTDTATPPLPTACGSCHGGVTVILGKPTHTAQGCGTTVGCHGYTGPTTVTTVMTAKVAPTSVKTGKSVTISGSVTPAAQLAGAKVAILVNRKVGSKWTKAKSGTATASATGAYSWKYKATKKGSYQVKVSVKATSTYTAKSVTKTFKAK